MPINCTISGLIFQPDTETLPDLSGHSFSCFFRQFGIFSIRRWFSNSRLGARLGRDEANGAGVDETRRQRLAVGFLAEQEAVSQHGQQS